MVYKIGSLHALLRTAIGLVALSTSPGAIKLHNNVMLAAQRIAFGSEVERRAGAYLHRSSHRANRGTITPLTRCALTSIRLLQARSEVEVDVTRA